MYNQQLAWKYCFKEFKDWQVSVVHFQKWFVCGSSDMDVEEEVKESHRLTKKCARCHGSVFCFILCFNSMPSRVLSVSPVFFPLCFPLPSCCMFVSLFLPAMFPPSFLLCAFPLLSHQSSSLLSLLTYSSSPHQCVRVYRLCFPCTPCQFIWCPQSSLHFHPPH